MLPCDVDSDVDSTPAHTILFFCRRRTAASASRPLPIAHTCSALQEALARDQQRKKVSDLQEALQTAKVQVRKFAEQTMTLMQVS